MLKPKTHLLNLILVISLMTTATFTSISLNPFSVTAPEQSIQKVSISTTAVRYGTLVVFVLLGVRSAFLLGNNISYFGPLEIPSYFRPIPSENVSISRLESTSATDLVLTTNSSGAIRVSLLPLVNYLVSISEQRFHITIPAQVIEGKTTVLVVAAHMLAYEVFYQFLQDRYSTGWVTPSDNAFLGIRSNANIASANDSVILEVERDLVGPSQSNGTTNLEISQTRAVVQIVYHGHDIDWLEVQPLDSFRVTNVLGIVMIVYKPTYTIIVRDT